MIPLDEQILVEICIQSYNGIGRWLDCLFKDDIKLVIRGDGMAEN